MSDLEMLSVVALTEDLLERGLRRGQVGTIVENLTAGVYEVEFSDDAGQSYALLPVTANKLMRLYHEPQYHAA
jgi:hypothetical protein